MNVRGRNNWFLSVVLSQSLLQEMYEVSAPLAHLISCPERINPELSSHKVSSGS